MQYHKYVFDLKNRKFTGKFEEMYQNEDKEGFDSWHQDEIDTLKHDLILTVLKRNNYKKILDVGCGKGTFTNRLKNELGDDVDITAIDISPTAISKAKKRYNGIKFLVRDASNLKFEFGEESFDLNVCSEIFWYILKDIHKILRDFKKILIRGGISWLSYTSQKILLAKKLLGLLKIVKTSFENILTSKKLLNTRLMMRTMLLF